MDKEFVDKFLKNAIFISNKLPKYKCAYIPKRIVKKLNLKDHQWVYLIINKLIHPVTYIKRKVAIPIRLRKLVQDDKNIEILIKPIVTNRIFFLSSFRPLIRKNNISSYLLYTHPLIENNVKLKIFIGNKFLYGTPTRGRIWFGKKIFEKLDVEPFRIYQFITETTNNRLNNKHLFENKVNINFEDCIKENKILISKLLPDFKIKDFGKQIEVFYEARCRDSKRLKINKEIQLSEHLLRLFGLFQAEGTKTKTNYVSFVNNDPNLIGYFKKTFNKIFGISNIEWSLEVCSSKNIEEIRNFWYNLLGINRLCVISSLYRNSKHGTANLKINNNTAREIVQRILKLIKNIVLSNKKHSGYFISGVLAGDGYLCTDKNRIKRIELYFDPNKIEDEFLFYLNCLKSLDIKNHYTKVYYQKNDKFLEEKTKKIVKRIRNEFPNITISPKKNIHGIGGVVFIHRRSDIKKLVNFKLFYPNIKYYNKFYKYWRD